MQRLLAILLAAALAAHACPRTAPAQTADTVAVARLELASSLVRAAQYERAIAILESVSAEGPHGPARNDMLGRAYEAVKRYDDALQLLDEAIARAPSGEMPSLLSEKARLHFLAGDEPAANSLWEESLQLSRGSEANYRTVYNSLVEVRLLDRAIDALLRGRSELGDARLFQIDLAYLYSHTGDHERSMEEYLGLIMDNERQLSYVRNRLSRVLEQEGALPAYVAAAERAAAAHPDMRSLRELLGWLYLEAGDYASAYTEYAIVDRLGEERGRAVFDFAERAGAAGAFEIALMAYNEALQHDAAAPVTADALLGRARMYILWGEANRESAYDGDGNRQSAPGFEAAAESLRRFLQEFPEDGRGADVLAQMARLQRDVFMDLDQATGSTEEIIRRHPGSEAANRARLELGRIAVLRNRLDEAYRTFGLLAETLLLGELAEEARYEQAMVLLYGGDIDGAGAIFDVLDENASTDVANDALSRRMLLLENTGPDSTNAALRAYGHLLLIKRQRRPAAAIKAADSLLAHYGGHSIADELRFVRAQALRAAGRSAEARTAFAEVALMYPGGLLTDRSLFLAAEILETELGDRQGALESYTGILRAHPGTLLAAEIRKRIRRLRTNGV